MKRNFFIKNKATTTNIRLTNQEADQKSIIMPFEDCNDQEIWEKLKSGDEKAFQYIYNFYFQKLINFGIQYVNDAELVKDCIQDLFIELRIKRSNLPIIRFSIKHYLYKSLRRAVFKKVHQAKGYSLESDFEKFADFEIKVSKEMEMIKHQISVETKRKLAEAINQLPKRQKETLLCYYYEGFTYEEIMSILEYSKIEYARIAVSKALKHLRKYMINDEGNIVSLLLTFFYASQS